MFKELLIRRLTTEELYACYCKGVTEDMIVYAKHRRQYRRFGNAMQSLLDKGLIEEVKGGE